MKTSTRRNSVPNVVSAVAEYGWTGVPAVYRRKTRKVNRQTNTRWLKTRYIIPMIVLVNAVLYALAR
jgi:hypothetical protein